MAKSSDIPGDIYALTMEFSRFLRKKIMSAQNKEDGMNPLQLHALLFIQEHEGLTMREFAEHLRITSPSATSSVNRLVKQKLVQRMNDPNNRRLVRLKLSATGKSMLARKLREHKNEMRAIFSLLSEPDQRELHRILSKLVHTLSISPPA